MTTTDPSAARHLRWNFQTLPYQTVDRSRVADSDLLFYVLVSASFVEITSDLYARNLIDFFSGDSEVQQWLAQHWEAEELQHGQALRHYVTTVWPELDWERAYRSFYAEYALLCRPEMLGPTRALEMAGRCVVETGTCSYYTMLARLSPCPVLSQLCQLIRTDEAYHYQHFQRYFSRYRSLEQPSRGILLKTLAHRIYEIDSEDARVAFRHAWQARHPQQTWEPRYYRQFARTIRTLATTHYPFRMAAHMLTTPLGLSLRNQQRLEHTLAASARLATRLTGNRRQSVA